MQNILVKFMRSVYLFFEVLQTGICILVVS